MDREDSYIERDDTALIQAFQADEEEAFDKLVIKHKNRVFNLCYRFVGSYEEADDCAQETFVKVYRSLKKFKFKSAFSTWLYAITVNTCKNKLSSLEYRYKKKMVRLDGPKGGEDGVYRVEVQDESMSPRVEIERKEKKGLIQKAIDSLPEQQKVVVVLRDIEGLSYEEIAEVAGFKPGTVKSKLARARQQLREKLKGLI
ncbi:MAG: sigma-70 family RNA polymerase sigma factor [Candidatus Omnitrophica bacterium]|nr:sigma-70 family RNA polymerase sigma factor [Candidatus Omnitrophota bacterium]